jgi:hypothetical protein
MEQQIADLLDASLLTPKLADMIFNQATIRLEPVTRPPTKYLPDGTPVWNPPMNSTQAMILESQNIDASIVDAVNKAGGGPSSSFLVSTVGKHWTISNEIKSHAKTATNYAYPQAGENYGFHFRSKKKRIDTDQTPVTNPSGIFVHQGQGWRHDQNHDDYSQNVVLVSNKVIVDGNMMRLQDVLADPELSWLANHSGPIAPELHRMANVPNLEPKFSAQVGA